MVVVFAVLLAQSEGWIPELTVVFSIGILILFLFFLLLIRINSHPCHGPQYPSKSLLGKHWLTEVSPFDAVNASRFFEQVVLFDKKKTLNADLVPLFLN